MFTDWALKFLDDAKAQNKPFFQYVAHGAPHFPLKAPANVIAKYRGQYRVGWDTLREARHRKQIELGSSMPSGHSRRVPTMSRPGTRSAGGAGPL